MPGAGAQEDRDDLSEASQPVAKDVVEPGDVPAHDGDPPGQGGDLPAERARLLGERGDLADQLGQVCGVGVHPNITTASATAAAAASNGIEHPMQPRCTQIRGRP
jgi:hypothetical protein